MKPVLALAILAALSHASVVRAEDVVETRVVWLNATEMQCKGCSAQSIINKAGKWCVVGQESKDGIVLLRVVAQPRKEGIEVALTQVRKVDAQTFVDVGPTKSVIVVGPESKELSLGEYRFTVSARLMPNDTSGARKS